MSTWTTIENEIIALLDDASFEVTGSKYTYLMAWGNRVIQDIARRVSVPNLLTSADLTAFTTSDYYQPLPANFMKTGRETMVYVGDSAIKQISIGELEAYDANHSETITSIIPAYAAIQEPNLYVYPMFAGTVKLHNYYRVPATITAGSDAPDLTETNIVHDMIVNGVCRHGFKWLNEIELMQLCESDYEKYLRAYEINLYANQFNRQSIPA